MRSQHAHEAGMTGSLKEPWLTDQGTCTMTEQQHSLEIILLSPAARCTIMNGPMQLSMCALCVDGTCLQITVKD